ncbi:hypothetical protein BDN70DRAFT_883281 [Pholiota conissans]|uniref:Uncharacterized protein n=1 Tax=Pholiota conissans TaxID=109636 RepID=A0A9P5YUE0_9AGAR|nr:hypothetical protein BDN70DRAFT_883281 [Pholiota conissans]
MSDILANFGCLDELTQVIYQGVHKFAVLSTVSDDNWTVHIGLSGQHGRWWRGYWSEDEIHEHFGSKLSDKLLEACAEKLADMFIQGEMCISDWSTEKGAKIKLTLGPTSKSPLHVVLVEMTVEEAAAHATKVFIDIALHAQSRKCQLYPNSTDLPAFKPLNDHLKTPRISAKQKEPSSEIRGKLTEPMASVQTMQELSDIPTTTQEKPKPTLRSISKTAAPTLSQTPTPKRPKGASLANPNKRARKYQALEFGSSDDE